MKKTALLILSAIAFLTASTWALSLTRPHCEDSPLKSVLTSVVFLGQFFLAAAIVGWFDPSKALTSLAVGLIGVPIVSFIWIVSLWPPKYFGFLWDLFLMMAPMQLLYAIPLSLAGGYGAAMIHRKINANPTSAST